MAEEKPVKAQEAEKEKEKQPEVEINEDFMKGVADELGIEMDNDDELANLLGDQAKKDKDKKDGDESKK